MSTAIQSIKIERLDALDVPGLTVSKFFSDLAGLYNSEFCTVNPAVALARMPIHGRVEYLAMQQHCSEIFPPLKAEEQLVSLCKQGRKLSGAYEDTPLSKRYRFVQKTLNEMAARRGYSHIRII